MDPGSRGSFRIPDLGSQVHILKGFIHFLGKKFYNSVESGPKFLLRLFKNKINFNFVIYRMWLQNFFFPTFSFVAVFGSGIRDGKIRIRDKHPGSATLGILYTVKSLHSFSLWSEVQRLVVGYPVPVPGMVRSQQCPLLSANQYDIACTGTVQVFFFRSYSIHIGNF
jgi:hypothetical protein